MAIAKMMVAAQVAILMVINLILILLIRPPSSFNLVSCLIKQPEQFEPFHGIPAAFGDLNIDKRTDIVVIGGDGYHLKIYYQQQKQPIFNLGSSCKFEKKIAQVYLADIENDGLPNILPLLISSKQKDKTIYELVSIVSDTQSELKNAGSPLDGPYSHAAALNSEDPSQNQSVVNNGTLANSSNIISEYLQLTVIPDCKYTHVNVEMLAQPLLFDLEGDLQTDFMSVDLSGNVTVWQPPKEIGSVDFIKLEESKWSSIDRKYFNAPHSNSFIDVNLDAAADLVFSSKDANIMYSLANSNFNNSFSSSERKSFEAIFEKLRKDYIFGQSALVDIDADGKIDHIIPRCKRNSNLCEIVYLAYNGHHEVIFKFDNHSDSILTLEEIQMGPDYSFPVTVRAADLDGDGYTDFVVVVKCISSGETTNKIVFLRNIEDTSAANSKQISRSMPRTFQIIDIPFDPPKPKHQVRLVILFDINEDGKVDMLIGSSEHNNNPEDLYITAKMNTQMVDACFMKVLVTNGRSSSVSNGQSARGPFICFELSQNDRKVRKGCAGQLAQSSHFALHAPYVIFGLGQTPHFVETLNVTIPGYRHGIVRTRVFEQIVPDAQVIIIPDPKDYPNSWDYKLFLSPMSDLVLSTFITLAVICIVIFFIICILHRKESLEDLAEHEEYKRHWPESR